MRPGQDFVQNEDQKPHPPLSFRSKYCTQLNIVKLLVYYICAILSPPYAL